ncbi:MAG TPA: SPOR domain-containing protein [Polaromonas sp.]|uniref:SPOR domain-containing protein n=1 Tax=Polaromonas sp. TaxID=1869339 RepID=UPI002D3E2193|nr:SPOR domain-containing protein [Polaromonas sp.]HYW58116.1 SPOR domain-containing protein [Polaromonas sp.]
MPLFNFRRSQPSAKAAGSAAPSESVEMLRKRAKHRLIGAAVLVLAGVVGFPLLFDTQPRPVAVDIPIEIPAKYAVKPLVMPVVPPAASAAASGKVAAPASLTAREEIVAERRASIPETPASSPVKNEVKAEPKPEPKPEAKAEAKAEPKPESKVDPKPEPKAVAKVPSANDEAGRAKALLEGKPAPEAEGRHVVQVGAFSDADKAKEVRQKLEKAGLKTYTQVADTKDGKRIRVRVGPFATKADADKAASKIKGLDLPAAILTL